MSPPCGMRRMAMFAAQPLHCINEHARILSDKVGRHYRACMAVSRAMAG
jgi:hypothetical protein